MKKVMIYAYTNFNLGDDLFIKVLCERYPNTKFVLNAPNNYHSNFKKITNLTIYRSDSLLQRGVNFILRLIKSNITTRQIIANRCDAIVHIGGSIFIQTDSWKKSLKHRRVLNNKPFFLLGANFGPYNNDEYYLAYQELFKTYTDICFRDNYSYNLFSELTNVRLADDVIFQLQADESKSKREIAISVIKPSIRPHLVGYDEIYYQKIKEVLTKFIDNDYSVTLMSFCENEGDHEAINEILKITPKIYIKNVKTHLYKDDIEAALNVISTSSFVVGTRFHAMILGWVYNKPVFPIAYSKKMTNVLEDINFKGSYTDFNDIHKLKAEKVYDCVKTNFINVSDQVINAEKQFEKLDEYLI